MAIAVPPPLVHPAGIGELAAAVACDGAVTVDLRALRGVQVDPVRGVAYVQGGALTAELDAATQRHGLAVTGARRPGAGVAGFVLGGGSGWLERRMGLAADHLRAARVMTATGTVVRATEEEHSELLWALRGGGVRLGVLLDLELGLRPVGPAVLGGVLAWPRTRAAAVVRTYRDLMAVAPDALGGGVRLRGGRVEVVVLFTGAPVRGTAHLAALRALAPVLDTVRERPYADLQGLPVPEAPRTVVLDALGDAVIDALLEADEPLLLAPLGGAFARTPASATAAGDRMGAWAVHGAADIPPWACVTPRDRARIERLRERWDPAGRFADSNPAALTVLAGT